jgi:aminoglycoside 6-adenylyltransferase
MLSLAGSLPGRSSAIRVLPNAAEDILSDYDVILIVEDSQPFVTDRTWLNDFSEVLVVFWDAVLPDPDHGSDQCGNVTQYVDGLKIDFTLWPVALFQRIVSAPHTHGRQLGIAKPHCGTLSPDCNRS